MKTSRCFAAALIFVCASVATAAPVVTRLDPEQVVAGTLVSIEGVGFVSEQCTSSCAPAVKVGGVPAVVREYSATHIAAIVPALETSGSSALVITTAAGESTPDQPLNVLDDPATRMRRVLLPVYFDGPEDGANGSRWTTDFWMRNSSPAGKHVYHCSKCWLTPTVRQLAAGETRLGLVARGRWWERNPSRLLYFESLDDVWMSLRLRELSWDDSGAGVKLPIVRDSDLRSGTLEILDVPALRGSRIMLRIYDVAAPPTYFRVHVYPLFRSSGERRQAPLLSFAAAATGTNVDVLRDVPSYAEIDLTSRIPPAMSEPLRITIESLKPDSRFWAFASVTENATHRVTIAMPE
jgi:hypothetical protein